MLDKLALKRLTASDLTFFEWHFKNRNAGNQKSINLNADVFFRQLYPALDTIVRRRQKPIPVDLWITGPDGTAPVNLQRKIIKGPTYKNWRLDGEFVYDPEESPGRFNALEPEDIALLGFEGELEPETVHLFLIGKDLPQDRVLFTGLDDTLGKRRMMVLESDALRNLCDHLRVPQSHPVWAAVTDEDLTEAAAGQAPAVKRLLSRPRYVSLSLHDLRKARQAAEEIGRLGEELVNGYLEERSATGEVDAYEWVSDSNAIAPYDFRVQRDGIWGRLEIKTTPGNFDREFHLPLSELREMVHGAEPYRIGRVYRAARDSAKLRVSQELRRYGKSILDAFSGLPDGVTPDGVTIRPDEAMFENEIDLLMPTDNE